MLRSQGFLYVKFNKNYNTPAWRFCNTWNYCL